MKAKTLPGYCTSSRALEVVDGVIVHYFSGRNVDPQHSFELQVCRNLFLDLNRPKPRRQWYMLEEKWPDKRMYASAHVLIGRDGETWRLVPFDRQAYHAGVSVLAGRKNCNAFTLGIELIGNITSGFTAAQYETLTALLAALQARYGFADDMIAGHDQVRWAAIQAGHSAKCKYDPSGRKDGQGTNFDWLRLRTLLAEAKKSPTAAGLEVGRLDARR